MLSWLDGLEELPDNKRLIEIVDMLLHIQYSKEKDYGSSWKLRGEYRGIIPNIDRKYDRLDKMTKDELDGKSSTLSELEDSLKKGEFPSSRHYEGKIDAIADLAVYCLLYLTFIKEAYPNIFSVWEEQNVPWGLE